MRKRIITSRETKLKNIIAIAEYELAKLQGPEILTYTPTVRTCNNHSKIGILNAYLNHYGILQGDLLIGSPKYKQNKKFRRTFYKNLYRPNRIQREEVEVATDIAGKLMCKAMAINEKTTLAVAVSES